MSADHRPARIALLLPRFSRYGGLEQFGYQLAEGLAKRGYDIEVICARQEADPPQGVRVVAVGRVPGPRVVKMLQFLIGAERVRKQGAYDLTVSLGKTWNQDVLRTGGGPLQGFWRLSIQAWEPGLPRLGKQLRRVLQPANWLTVLLERRMFTATPYIIANSDVVRRWIVEHYPNVGAPGDRTHLTTIFNSPRMDRFHPPSTDERAQARTQFGIAEQEFALGVATTNFRLKGVGPLIRSLVLLDENVTLHVAGGRNADHYRALAERLGLGRRVRFHGKVSDMPAFYHALDMFVLPTFYDTLANVILEAMASGLKTLCSNRAGAVDFLPPDQVLRDPGDPSALASAVSALRAKSEIVPYVPKGGGLDEFMDFIERVLKKKKD